MGMVFFHRVRNMLWIPSVWNFSLFLWNIFKSHRLHSQPYFSWNPNTLVSRRLPVGCVSLPVKYLVVQIHECTQSITAHRTGQLPLMCVNPYFYCFFCNFFIHKLRQNWLHLWKRPGFILYLRYDWAFYEVLVGCSRATKSLKYFLHPVHSAQYCIYSFKPN